MKKKPTRQHAAHVWHKGLIAVLEPRLMYDGAAGAAALDGLDAMDGDNSDPAPDAGESTAVTDPGADSKSGGSDVEAVLAALNDESQGRKELAVIDASVQDAETLVDGLNSEIDAVFHVDNQSSGLSQLAKLLAGTRDVDAVHIFSHGSKGEMTLGSDSINGDNAGNLGEEFATIGQSMSENGDILIYGCDVGGGEKGLALIEILSGNTGADIAASSDDTSASIRGGNWDLEVESGQIETFTIEIDSYSGVLGTPSITGMADTTYTENDTASIIDDSITVTNGGSYDGQYVEFSLSNTESSDQLTLTNPANINASGAVSFSGANVYLGNGSSRDVIGSIDSVYNGVNGESLRINFVSNFSNSSFESGLSGWTAMDEMIDLGSTEIAGYTTSDTSNYGNNSGSDGNDNDVPSSSSYSTTTSSDQQTDGSYALKLTSNMTTKNGYDVVHGPAVFSSEFEASDGDVIYFDWRAYAGSDDFDAFGYILNAETGVQTEVIDATGGSNTDWVTESTTIPDDGTYRFVFVNGTYDATGGKAAGGTLWIDNVRVYGSKVNDSVVSSIASQIAYENTSDNPSTADRTFTVTAVNANEQSDSASCTISITAVDDAPQINVSNSDTQWTEGEAAKAVAPTLTVNDVDGGIDGARIAIGEGFVQGEDQLSFTAEHGITGSYDRGTGILSLNGTGTAAAYQDVLRSVTYSNSTTEVPDVSTRTISFSLGSSLRNPENGHFYEYVANSGISWSDARDAASGKRYYGLEGYLATVTSGEENSFIAEKLTGDGWMGASDAQNEGTWQWVMGPEAGSQFWAGDPDAGSSSTNDYGSPYSDAYANWASFEPNNADGGRGGEDYAHFYGSSGEWNDYAGTNPSIEGYVVEYGGLGSDPLLNLSASKQLHVHPANDVPEVMRDTSSVDENDTANGNVLANDGDVDAGVIVNNGATDQALVYDARNNGQGLFTGGAKTIDVSLTLEGIGDTGATSLMSYAVQNDHNNLLIYSEGGSDSNYFLEFMNGKKIDTGINIDDLNGGRHTFNFSWESDTGDAVFYLDGEHTATGNANEGQTISAGGVLNFGQEQDAVGGNWDSTQIFSGAYYDINIATDSSSARWVMADADASSVISRTNGYILNFEGENTPRSTSHVSAVRTGAEAGTGTPGTLDSPLAGNYGSLTLSADGSYRYEADADATEALAEGETVTDTFTYTHSDGNGGTGTAELEFTVIGKNDAPEVSLKGVEGSITEGSGDLNETGSVTFTDVDLTDRPTATEATASVSALKADGTTELPLTTAQQQAIEGAFSITEATENTNDGTVTWDYTITEDKLDFLAEGESVEAVFTITVNDDDGGTDTQDVTVNITGAVDAPVITTVDVVGDITEGSGDLNETGSVTFTDVDLTDRPTATEATSSVSATRADGSTTLTLSETQKADIENAFTIAHDDSNTNDGTVTWDYTITEDKLDFLAEGESVEAVFTITVNDDDGGTDTQDVTVNITGAVDAPVITTVDVVGDIAEGTTLSDNGSVTFTDVDLTDRPSATEATKSVTATRADGSTTLSLSETQKADIENAFSITEATENTNDGTVAWDYTITEDKLDFLAEDESVAAVFTITVNDDNGGTDTQDVTVNITGAVDAPVITTVDVVGDITEGTTLSDNGSVTFTDVDLTDRPTATEATKSVTATRADGSTTLSLSETQKADIKNAFTIAHDDSNTNDGTVTWDYTITEDKLDFLAEDESVEAVFTITVNDDNGGTDTRDVTVNITGAVDAPVITTVDVVGDITEGTTLSDNGSVTFTDVDLTDRPTATEATKSVTATRADESTTLTLSETQKADIKNAFSITEATENTNDGTVTWDYTITEGKLDFLAEGESVEAVFTITVNDDNGGTDTQNVTVNITGTNDSPAITIGDGDTNAVDLEETDSGLSSKDNTLSLRDLDTTDTVAMSAVLNTRQLDAESKQMATDSNEPSNDALLEMFTVTDQPIHGSSQDGTITWSFESGDEAFDYLAAGEQLQLTYTLTATDAQDATDTQDVTVTVVGLNDGPTVANPIADPEPTQALQAFAYEIPRDTFADLDTTDTFTYTADGLPEGLEFNPETLVFSGKPSEAGDFDIDVTATDSQGASITSTFTLTVNPAPTADTGSDGGDGGGDQSAPGEASGPEMDASDSVDDNWLQEPLQSWDEGQGNQDSVDTSGNDSGLAETGNGQGNGSGSDSSETGQSAAASAEGNPAEGVPTGQSEAGTQNSGTGEADVPGTEMQEGRSGSVSQETVRVRSDGSVEFVDDGGSDTGGDLAVEHIRFDSSSRTLQVELQDASGATGSTFSATLPDGSPLPTWLQVNSMTGEVSGTPPEGVDQVQILITATDGEGKMRALELSIDFETGEAGTGLDTTTNWDSRENDPVAKVNGMPPFAQQLAEAQQNMDGYGERLMAALA